MKLHIEVTGPGCPLAAEALRPFEAPEGFTLGDVLPLLGMQSERVMLAFVNGHMVTLSTVLHEGDHVDLCMFICGG